MTEVIDLIDGAGEAGAGAVDSGAEHEEEEEEEEEKAPKTSSSLPSRGVRIRRCGQVLRLLSVAVRRPCAHAVLVPAVQGVREYDGPSDSVHRHSVGHSCYATETGTHSAKLCRTPSRSHNCSFGCGCGRARRGATTGARDGPESAKTVGCRSCSVLTVVDISVVAQGLECKP